MRLWVSDRLLVARGAGIRRVFSTAQRDESDSGLARCGHPGKYMAFQAGWTVT